MMTIENIMSYFHMSYEEACEVQKNQRAADEERSKWPFRLINSFECFDHSKGKEFYAELNRDGRVDLVAITEEGAYVLITDWRRRSAYGEPDLVVSQIGNKDDRDVVRSVRIGKCGDGIFPHEYSFQEILDKLEFIEDEYAEEADYEMDSEGR